MLRPRSGSHNPLDTRRADVAAGVTPTPAWLAAGVCDQHQFRSCLD